LTYHTQLLVNLPVRLHYITSSLCTPSSCYSSNPSVLAYWPHSLLWWVSICQHNTPTFSCPCWFII